MVTADAEPTIVVAGPGSGKLARLQYFFFSC